MFKNIFWRILVLVTIAFTSITNPVIAGPLYTRGPNFNASFNPQGSAQVGYDVNIHIKVDSANPGATKINVSCGGVTKGETSEVEFDSSWRTGDCPAGNANINICTKAPDDPNWQDPNCADFGYQLTAPPTPAGPSRGPNISVFSFSPESATVGDGVNIHIRVDSNNPGATTITPGCGSLTKNETSEVEFDSSWNTSSCGDGNINVRVCSRATDDPNWANASCTDRNYYLAPKQVSVPAPTADLNVDSDNIKTGSCTNLHWATANATSVEIDGQSVNLYGDLQVCPPVTKKYSLLAYGDGGTASRNLTVVVSGSPQSPNVADYFSTKDLINIDGNLYVIVNGEKRHIPNPETLDALGLSRDRIDNKGFSTSDLNKIPSGGDVPDVNRDKAGFDAFKAKYFPELSPIVPNQSTSVPSIPAGQFDPHAAGVCSGWETRLWVGAYARVTNQGDQLKLRTGPTLNDGVITKMSGGQKFTVIGGPTCSDSFTWWNIQGTMGTGWAVESGDLGGKTYWWLAPMTDPPAPATQTSIPVATLVVVSTNTPIAQSGAVSTNTPQPLVEAPIETVATEEPFYCSWWLIGWLACDLAEANSAQAWCQPQCMTLMRDTYRPDMNLWSKGTGDSSPLDVLANAEKETPYNDPPKTGPLMQVRVRESTEQPEAGDLIIWEAGCGGASKVGHIGEVASSSGITVNITDSNWDNKCGPRTDVQIQILPCMRFVTEPFPAGTYVPTVQPTVINCDDYQGWQNFACNYIPWWKP